VREDGSARAKPLDPRNMRPTYDGDRAHFERRVSVVPGSMLDDLIMMDAVERAIVVTVFCRWWPREKPVNAERVRKELRLGPKVFRRALEWIVERRVVAVVKDGLVPLQSFGPATDAAPPRRSRDMPSDWLDLRDEVFERDLYACVYCGSGRDLYCDHVNPVALGGSHDIANLVTSCAACNLSKGSKTVAEWRPDLIEWVKSR
jgi:5-methylcytosine-specific restriction endonuclease McrA